MFSDQLITASELFQNFLMIEYQSFPLANFGQYLEIKFPKKLIRTQS